MKDSGGKQPFLSGTSPPAKHKKSRFFLKLFLGLAGLFALLIILILSVNLNAFREPITKALSQATGMKIKIEFLDWSFSEGLKIDCKGVQIFSGETEEELLSTKELLISLNWLPLLEQRIVVDSISLVEPVLKVTVELSSVNDSLPALKKTSGSDANSSSSSPSLNEPSSLDKLQTVREFLKNPNFSLTAINLIAGQVIFQDKETGKEITLGTEARMQIQRDERRVGLVLESIKLATGNLIAEGEILADDFLSAHSPMQAHIRLNSFKVSDLLPVLEWVPKSRRAIYRKLKLKGDIHTLDLKLKTPIDSVMDLDSLMSSADAALTLKGKELSLVQYGNTISASTLDTDIQWKDQQWVHKIVLGILGGNVETQGQIFLRKGYNEADDWRLDSKLILANINLRNLKTQFFSQVDQFPQAGTLSANFHIRGPALHPQLIQGEGNISAQNLTFPVNGTVISVADLEGKGKWLGDRLNHQFHLTALGGEMTMEGDLGFKKDNRGQWNPMIDSDVISKSIKLADLRPLAQKGWFPEKGIFTGKVHIHGPVLRPQLLRAEGEVEILDTAIRHQETDIQLAAIKGTGRWFKNQLAHDVKMKVFDGSVRIKGNLELKKTKHGKLNPLIDSDVITQSIQLPSLQPLVQKAWFPMKGALNGTVHLSGPVLLPEAIKSRGYLKFSDLEVMVNNAAIAIPAMEFNGTWANSRLIHDVKLKVLDGNIQTKGQLLLKKDRKGNRDSVLDSKVFIKLVSLKQLKTIVGKNWFPHKGILDGTLQVRGSVTRPQSMKAKGQLRVRNAATQFRGKNITLSHVEGRGSWQKDNLKHHIKANILGGEVSLKGDLNFKKNKQGELDPVIHLDVIPQSIQLSKLRTLIAKDWFPEKGAVTGSIHLKGPVKRFSEVALTGKLAGSKIRLNFQGKPVVISKTLLAFKPNAKNHNQIDFSLKDISIGDIRLQKSIGRMVYTPKTVELTQGKIWPKTGQVSLNGNYEFETKDYKLKFTGDGLRLEDYKGEFLEGPLAFKGNLFGKVLTKGFKKGLSGNVKVRSENGKLFKAGDALTQIINTLNLKFLQGAKKGVAIDFLGGECAIKNGVLSTKNFRMLSPSLKLWLNGKADLSEEIINAEAMAIPLQRMEKIFRKVDKEKERLKNKMKEVPLLGEILGGSEDQGGLMDEVLDSIPILGNDDKNEGQPRDLLKFYFTLDGPLDKPKVKFVPEKTLGLKK
jgi:hypothetical protein